MMNRDERAQYGPQIHAERKRLGMSQAQLASAAGTTMRTIGSVE
ncbi:MAG: helix-turn-helix domain-containing protein, partial [Gammaproteobacteria bacterium]